MQSTSRPLRILALTHDLASEGCTFARIITPLRALENRGKIDYEHVRILPWRLGAAQHVLRDLPRLDVLWIGRPRHSILLPIIRVARRLARPVLIDIDDWLLDVPAEHPEAAYVRTRPRQETLRIALRAADAVTVSTPILAERCVALGVRAHVLPNAVDCAQFKRKPCTDGRVTIGFCGTTTHASDVSLIALPLHRLLHARPERVRVVTVGCPIPELQGLEGYTHYAPVAATDYPTFLSELRLDIGLAPLHDTPFNRAKSDIKYLEYSATGAATIASPVGPYRGSVHPDRGVLVQENTLDAWSAAITQLVEEQQLRRHLAAAAYEWVHNTRSIEAMASAWYGLFQDYATGRRLRSAAHAEALDHGRLERLLANIVLRQVLYYSREIPRLVLQKAPFKSHS